MTVFDKVPQLISKGYEEREEEKIIFTGFRGFLRYISKIRSEIVRIYISTNAVEFNNLRMCRNFQNIKKYC